MVKKLFKQEMIYYGRSMVPVFIILFGIAVLGRFVQFFERDGWMYAIVSSSAVVAFFTAAVTMLVMATLFTVVRYYKNLFTGEGYLTLTLPATVEQHLFAKISAAMLINILAGIMAILSFVIFLGREWVVEIYKAAVYLGKDMISFMGSHLIFYIIELLVLIFISLLVEILSYYMCLSLGQLFNKNRILAAIGIYFGLYMAMQIIGTVLSIVFTICIESLPVSFFTWVETHTHLFIHLCFFGIILLMLIGAVIQYVISRWVLKKRLNLE